MKPIVQVAAATVLLHLFACSKAKEIRRHEPADDAVAVHDAGTSATASAGDDAAVAACRAAASTLADMVSAAEVAASPVGEFEQARAAWQATPASCRQGSWHLAAARLLRWSSDPLAVDSSSFANPDQALVAGLALAQPDADLLVFAAFVTALQPTMAASLPADACARIATAPTSPGPAYVTSDKRHYVCGHAALRKGDFPGARAEFEAIEHPRYFPDLELRLAEAMIGTGENDKATPLAAAAAGLREMRGRSFGATLAEVEAIRKHARELAQRR